MMRNRTPHRLRDFRPMSRTAYPWFRRLAPFLLMLGILAGSDLTSLRAQKIEPDKEKKKGDEKPFEKDSEPPKLKTDEKRSSFDRNVSAFYPKVDPGNTLKDVLPPPKSERVAGPLQGMI